MRVTWNNDRFEAEISSGEHFRDDIESIKAAGFKTSGPPQWYWYATKAASLNKLRENRPKSGLVLTELALQQYKQINEKEQQKIELQKVLKKGLKQAAKLREPKPEEYFDELGFMCLKVEPSKTPFVPTYTKSRLEPTGYCVICGDPIFGWPDYDDICMWCSAISNKKRECCE